MTLRSDLLEVMSSVKAANKESPLCVTRVGLEAFDFIQSRGQSILSTIDAFERLHRDCFQRNNKITQASVEDVEAQACDLCGGSGEGGSPDGDCAQCRCIGSIAALQTQHKDVEAQTRPVAEVHVEPKFPYHLSIKPLNLMPRDGMFLPGTVTPLYAAALRTRSGGVDLHALRLAANELGAWFRSGNSVPVDVKFVMRERAERIKADIDRLLAIIDHAGKGDA